MNRWPTKQLGEIAETVMGQAPPGNECNFDGKGTPFVKAGEFGGRRPIIREWTTKPLRLAKSSDVLVCVVGATCGKLNLGADCAIGRSVAAIRPDSSLLNQGFLYAFLRSWTLRLRSGSQGSAQGVITRNMLESIPVPVPPLAEQARIVKLLDEADELQKLRAQADRRTDALIPAIFHKMFGDETSENSKPLGEVCVKITDGVHITPTYVDEGVPFLRVTDIQDDEIAWSSVKRIPQKEYEQITRRVKPEKGDVLYSKNGTIGIAKEIAWERPFAHFVSLALLKPNRKVLNPTFLTAWLNTPDALRQAVGRSKTGTVTNLHLNEIRKMRIPCPSMEAQASFVQQVAEIRAVRNEQAANRRRLDDLFQSTLHRAFQGEL